jgi:hypothetical protein
MKNRLLLVKRTAVASSLVMAFAVIASPAVTLAANYVLDHAETYETVPTYEGAVTSFTGRSPEEYSVGYYIENGAIVGDYSLMEDDTPVTDLDFNLIVYDNESDYTDDEADYIFNPVIAKGAETDLTLTGSMIAFDNSDGALASDFSGRGAMIVATDYAKVLVDKMMIYTDGFVRAAFIPDNHGQILVKDSMVGTMGANPLTEIYDGYVNSADQSIMISPPWVLGIQGGARLANMLGESPTLTVINSYLVSGAWGVLSTDAGSNFMMNVVNTDVEILPMSRGGMSSGNFRYSHRYGSGYGSYIIGDAQQYFYGTHIKGATYGSILAGGDGYFSSSWGEIELKDADGGTIDTINGRGRPSVIQSVFGFMTHNSGSINVLDGTLVQTEEATFLYKAGDVDFVADKAMLKPRSGIILQMIDNDDSIVGAEVVANGPVFNTEFYEDEGWPSENGNDVPAENSDDTPSENSDVLPPEIGDDVPAEISDDMPAEIGDDVPAEIGDDVIPDTESGSSGSTASNSVTLSLTNGHYKGNVFNGTGYYTQLGDALEVNIGEGAVLKGAISLTETRHVDENGYQNTYFTIDDYYYLGHVENRNHRNGNSTLSVNLTDGATWKVTGESYISSLMVEDGAIIGSRGKTVVMTVDGVSTPIEQGQLYEGEIVIQLENEE